jgi:hypothetical protein
MGVKSSYGPVHESYIWMAYSTATTIAAATTTTTAFKTMLPLTLGTSNIHITSLCI